MQSQILSDFGLAILDCRHEEAWAKIRMVQTLENLHWLQPQRLLLGVLLSKFQHLFVIQRHLSGPGRSSIHLASQVQHWDGEFSNRTWPVHVDITAKFHQACILEVVSL